MILIERVSLAGVTEGTAFTWAVDCLDKGMPNYIARHPEDSIIPAYTQTIARWIGCRCDNRDPETDFPCEACSQEAEDALTGALGPYEKALDDAQRSRCILESTFQCDCGGRDPYRDVPCEVCKPAVEAALANYVSDDRASFTARLATTIGLAIKHSTVLLEEVVQTDDAAELTWRLGHLAELCGYSLNRAEVEVVCTMLMDGWTDPVLDLFEIAPAICGPSVVRS